jgi:sorting nexin-8
MSLFGSSPEESAPINTTAASKSRNSLFDDEASPPGSKSSLFADDDAPTSSPWGMPTPKKAARNDLIKNLLDSSAVPDSYIDTFDNVLKVDGSGGKISPAGITKVLSAGKLGADEKSRITNLITSGGQLADLGRNEFNVLLALVGLAQEHEDITLDGVDERRRSQCFFSIPIRLTYADNRTRSSSAQAAAKFVNKTNHFSRRIRIGCQSSSASKYSPTSS